MSQFQLDWIEFSAVIVSLVVSVVLSFRYYKRSPLSSTGERSKLPFGSILMSLIASSTSGVSMLGKPAESYAHGVEFVFFITMSLILDYFMIRFVFLSVILKLKTASIYEYFDLRFDSRVRKLVSVPYILMRIMGISLAVLPPVLVIHQMSGIRDAVLTAVLTLLTTFYTMIGGFKGVVWTDALQGVIMIASMAILTAISLVKVGGLGRVLEIAYGTNRLDIPPLSLDPTDRISVWAYGMFVCGLSTIVFNQSVYQRFRSLSTEKEIKIALVGMILGVGTFTLTASFIGISIYAYYHGCDPKNAHFVDSYSNVIVFWINEVGQSIKGIRGLYIAGITCASISTMSTHLNTVAELIGSDLSKGNPSRRLLSLVTLGIGLLATATALIIKNTGSLVELAFTFNCLEGVASGLFILGTLFVWANAKGALAGGISTIVLFTIVAIGAQFSNASVPKTFSTKIMRTDLCPNVHNSTEPQNLETLVQPSNNVFFLFKLSPFSMGTMSTLMTVFIGLAVSLMYPDARKMTKSNSDLFSHWVHRFLIREERSTNEEGEASINLFIVQTPK